MILCFEIDLSWVLWCTVVWVEKRERKENGDEECFGEDEDEIKGKIVFSLLSERFKGIFVRSHQVLLSQTAT